ncbi:MAG: hypothetical protein ACLFWM_08375 [Actinomycetota bacterium]
MSGRILRPLILICLSVVASACVVTRLDTEAEVAVPDGPVEVVGDQATGDVTVLGTGITGDTGWRLAAYPATDGICLQVELVTGNGGSGSASCGPVEEDPPEPITRVGAGSGGGGMGHVDGIARSDVAEVWLQGVEGRRVPATLHEMSGMDVDASVFFLIVPPGFQPESVVALDADGGELGRADVSHAFRTSPQPATPAP